MKISSLQTKRLHLMFAKYIILGFLNILVYNHDHIDDFAIGKINLFLDI